MGVDSIQHKGVGIATSTVSKQFQSYLLSLDSLEYNTGYVPPGYEHRPDLISDLFYNTVKLDWLILLFNGIDDPFESLNVGDMILIPKLL